MNPYMFVVDNLALAAYLIASGFEYRLAGAARFAFEAGAHKAADEWRRRASTRANGTGSVTDRSFLPKSHQ
jgi:hypothetical protein